VHASELPYVFRTLSARYGGRVGVTGKRVGAALRALACFRADRNAAAGRLAGMTAYPCQ
jgi:hypothetical protein